MKAITSRFFAAALALCVFAPLSVWHEPASAQVGTYPGRQISTGNGATTVFPYNFRILTSADLQVALDGIVQSSGYTVSGVGDAAGGNVTFTTAPASGVQVLRQRVATFDRATDYQRSGAFSEETVDKDFDRAIMLGQQLDDRMGRTLRAPATDAVYPSELPATATRAGKYLAFDGSGHPVVSSGTGSDTGLRSDLAATTGGSSLVTHMPSGTGAVARTLQDILRYDQPVSVLSFIPLNLHAGILDGTNATALQTYIQAALTAHRRVHFPCGTYLITSGVYSVWSDRIEITGEPGCTLINGTGTGYTSLWVGGVATNYNPVSYASGKSLTASPAKGDSTITLSAPDIATLGIVAGSVIRITTSDVFYTGGSRGGELAEVLSVSGTTVTLTTGLNSGYTAANTVVIRENAPTIRLYGITIQRDSDADFGLVVAWGKNVEIANVCTRGARYTNAEMYFLYGFEIHGYCSRDSWYSGTGTSYGLAITSSYYGNIHSSRPSGGRHALVITGYEPSRFITVSNNTLMNRTSETVGAFDVHAPSEYITATGNSINGGVNMACHNSRFANNTVVGGTNTQPMALFSIFRTSNFCEIGGTFESTMTASGQAVVWINSRVDGITTGLLRLTGQISGKVNSSDGAVMIGPFGASAGANWTISSLSVDAEVSATTGSAASAYALLVYDGNRGNTHYPIITNGWIKGRYSATSGDRAIGLLNLNTVTKSGDIVLRDVFGEAGSRVFYTDGARSIAYVGGTVKGGGVVYANNISGIAEVSGVKIFDAVGNGGIELGSGVTQSLLTGNYFSGVKGTVSDASTSKKLAQGYSGGSGNTVAWMAAVPTTGTWKQGDVIWNTGAAAAASPGWLCVTSGTFSAFTDNTGDTTNGSAVITGMTSTTGLSAGDYVTLSAGFASTGPHRVESIDSATSITVSVNSNATTSNITVSTPDPVFKTQAVLAAELMRYNAWAANDAYFMERAA